MPAFLRSGLVLVVAVTVAIGVTTLPSRAADESKALLERINKLEKKVSKLEAKLQYVQVVQDPINGLAGPHMIFEGCNVHVRSGSGDSTDGTVDLSAQTTIPDTAPLGLGNLIVGYNEQSMFKSTGRGGSHNLIVGPGHNYPSVAGVVFGQENRAKGPLSNVTGGFINEASGYASSVSGGSGNTATAYGSSVSGGNSNTASGDSSSVSGGDSSEASGYISSVSGGELSNADGNFSNVSGGFFRAATGEYDWVAGALGQDY